MFAQFLEAIFQITSSVMLIQLSDSQVIFVLFCQIIHLYSNQYFNDLHYFSFTDDAKVFSNHARKKNIDVEDVRLAVQMYTDKNVTSPPPRDLLLEVARTKNTSTLPIPKPTSGLRLPPDRFCLTSCNFKLKSSKKQPPRSGPYYYGSATASTASQMRNEGMKNKVNT